MKSRRLLVLSGIALALGCEGHQTPTGPSVPIDPSKMISDGAHGGNPDFFFLPPLLRNPVSDPNFEAGKFNGNLRPSLTVEICELQGAPIDAQGLPVAATDCVTGDPVKKFPAGTVRLQNPPDGFYQVIWNTRESNLDVTKYYRIKVLVAGSNIPFGFADVDPVANMTEFRNARTGEVIPLNDDSTLPINFRIENGGGPTLCGGGALCASATVTNDNPNGDVQVVQVQGNNGPIAGVVIPDGWLPAGGPQSVVVTINSVNTGVNDVAAGTQQFPCHANLPLMQFNGCFNFSTIPALAPIADGHQFAQAVTVVACFVLHDTDDPRYRFAQLWSSGPNEPPHPLVSVSDALVLTAPTEHNCGTNFSTVIGSSASWSTKLSQLVSLSWGKVSGGVGRVFGVKTAYAVDLGLGGLSLDFSNVSPAVSARIDAISTTTQTIQQYPGAAFAGAFGELVRIVGTQVHNSGLLTTGIGGLPVNFAVGTTGGFLSPRSNIDARLSAVTEITNPNPYDVDFPNTSGWVAPSWWIPNVPGTYTMSASGQATGGPIVFTTVVTPGPASLIQGAWQNTNASTSDIRNLNITVDGDAIGVQAFGVCAPTDCDWGFTSGGTLTSWNRDGQLVAVWDQGFAVQTVTIKYLSADLIEVTNFCDFTPADGRTDFTVVERFRRPT